MNTRLGNIIQGMYSWNNPIYYFPVGTGKRLDWVWNMESPKTTIERFQAASREILEQSKERAIPSEEERLPSVALSDYIMKERN